MLSSALTYPGVKYTHREIVGGVRIITDGQKSVTNDNSRSIQPGNDDNYRYNHHLFITVIITVIISGTKGHDNASRNKVKKTKII